ncbi:hypothetical protein BKA70DRAFT_1448177 [Coprinopsis sp. MPI-PUGE-AT-0042]|nr:hypothetical protein BKA70DRAFT_1448177 [Coprinopsis sp. MPI-PUGE-AT-0042]
MDRINDESTTQIHTPEEEDPGQDDALERLAARVPRNIRQELRLSPEVVVKLHDHLKAVIPVQLMHRQPPSKQKAKIEVLHKQVLEMFADLTSTTQQECLLELIKMEPREVPNTDDLWQDITVENEQRHRLKSWERAKPSLTGIENTGLRGYVASEEVLRELISQDTMLPARTCTHLQAPASTCLHRLVSTFTCFSGTSWYSAWPETEGDVNPEEAVVIKPGFSLCQTASRTGPLTSTSAILPASGYLR